MNFSRLIPLLMLLLPAVSGIPLSAVPPSELCPLVQILEHELCANNDANHNNPNAPIHDMCVLLHIYNATFCTKPAHHRVDPLSDAGLSVRTLEHEFINAKVKNICHIIQFMNQTMCASSRTNELCPLLTFAHTEPNRSCI
jgi:hypothetical protein